MPVLHGWSRSFTMNGISLIGSHRASCFLSRGDLQDPCRLASGASVEKNQQGNDLWLLTGRSTQDA